jgi:hypothetical protein
MQKSEIETSDLSTLKTPHIAVRAGGEKNCKTINRDSIKRIFNHASNWKNRLLDHQQRFYQVDQEGLTLNIVLQLHSVICVR